MTVLVEEPRTITIPEVTREPSLQEKLMQQMIDRVKAGRWCRDTAYDGQGRGCALGLISLVTH